MATKLTSFFDLPSMTDYLGVKTNADDTAITNIIDAVSERIKTLTGRAIVDTTFTRTLDVRGKSKIFLRGFPIDSVSLIRTRPSMTAAFVSVLSTDYELDDELGIIYLTGDSGSGANFPSGPRTTEVTYVEGYDVKDGALLPSDLMQAARDWIKFTYGRKSAGTTMMTQVSIGPFSASTIPEPPRDVLKTVTSYRRHRI